MLTKDAKVTCDGQASKAADLKAGAVGSRYNLCADPRLNHEVRVTSGVLEAACAAVLSAFFSERR